MAFAQRQRFGIKPTGLKANVPNNDLAKLMYYFRCVCTAVEYDMTPQIRRLTNFSNWMRLSDFDIRQLITFCYVFSPDILNNKVFFHSDALCGNDSNEFYEISQVTDQFLVVPSVIAVAGQQRRVTKIMVYKISWMANNYYGPFRRLLWYYGRAN